MLIAWLGLAVAGDDVVLEGYIERMEAAVANFQSVTYDFRTSERAGQRMKPTAHLSVKFRKPFDLFCVWRPGPSEGRELLYRRGWNNGNMRIYLGSWTPRLNLDPVGSLATRGERHNIMFMGYMKIAQIIVDDATRLRDGGYPREIRDLGEQTVRGSRSRCFDMDLPKDKDPNFYAFRSEMCFDEASQLPSRVKSWDMVDGSLVVVEDYEYGDIRVNSGLTDLDFDTENPAYHF